MTNNNVKKVYGYVIDEVIKNVREPFLNDGVDEQVLQELKQIWHSKVSQSRAVETNEPKSHLAYVANQQKPTAHHQMTHQQPVATTVATATLSAPQTLSKYVTPGQFVQQYAHTQILLPQGSSGATLQHFLPEGLKGNPPPLHPAYHGITTIQHARTQQPLQAVVSQHGTTQQSLARPSVIFQVDGPNDSDSEEDDDFSGFGELDNDESEEKPVEDLEDPLNSDDDESGEDDPSDHFDTDNVVVCQFDRITRSKNKWKFHLKDGIMNLNGRDYVFQKANGEAEW